MGVGPGQFHSLLCLPAGQQAHRLLDRMDRGNWWLTEVWGAKWRRNNGGQQTECGRQKKVIDLVTALSARPNWNVSLALRFLTEKYETRYTPRKFCDWLKPDNVQAVLVAAVTFC